MPAKKVRAKKAPARKPVRTRRKAAAPVRRRPRLAVVPLASASVTAIGQPWPGRNSIRMAEIVSRDGKPGYHLELVCGADGKPIVLEGRKWGDYGKSVPGSDSRHDGLANTEAMLTAGNKLAKEVRALGDGCYIGAIFEVQAVCANNAGLLPLTWFWSSTQNGADSARFQDFEYGYSGWSNKLGSHSVFVLRRVYR